MHGILLIKGSTRTQEEKSGNGEDMFNEDGILIAAAQSFQVNTLRSLEKDSAATKCPNFTKL